MKFARVGAPAVVALLVLGLLSACGGGDDNSKATTTRSAGQASDEADEGINLTLVAQNTKFDRATLEAPAGKDVTLTMENKDSIDHTFTLYQTASATEKLAGGQAFAGPSSLAYQFSAPETPGTYHFQCDIHPTVMKGDFVVK